MPLRAFIDSDADMILWLTSRSASVLMPLRAFIDSDEPERSITSGNGKGGVLMPLRAFIDSDVIVMLLRHQAMQWLWVLMPLRAFIDSDVLLL